MHPSFGPVPIEVFAEAVAAPYGKASSIIRRFVPEFGLAKGAGELKTYKVKLERQVANTQTAYVYVEAASEDDAEAIADSKGAHESDWDSDYDDEAGSHYVVGAELKQP